MQFLKRLEYIIQTWHRARPDQARAQIFQLGRAYYQARPAISGQVISSARSSQAVEPNILGSARLGQAGPSPKVGLVRPTSARFMYCARRHCRLHTMRDDQMSIFSAPKCDYRRLGPIGPQSSGPGRANASARPARQVQNAARLDQARPIDWLD